MLFAGDMVEYGATPYCGDAHFAGWPTTLATVKALGPDMKALGPEQILPGRGRSLMTRIEVEEAVEGTVGFTQALFARVKHGVASRQTLKHIYDDAMAELRSTFNVTRAWDEANLDGRARPGNVARTGKRQTDAVRGCLTDVPM